MTGAARRIGAAIVQALHDRDCRVLIHYHNSAEDAGRLADRLNRVRSGSASVLQADLAVPGGPESLASGVRELTDRLDVLVNNASRFYPSPVAEVTGEVWKDLMGSNLRAPFFLCQALMTELGEARGSIVNILDIHAERPMRGHAVYCMAKAGLAMMTRVLACDLAPDIRVNGVAPGAILWPANEPPEQVKEAILGKTALGRLGTAQDVAGAVAYLALDAPYVTGQVLVVDGGRSLNV